MRTLFATIVTLSAITLSPKGRADACTAPECLPGSIIASGSVPANVAGFWWEPAWNDFEQPVATTPKLYSEDSSVEIEVTKQHDGAFVIAPTTPLKPGQDYTLELDKYCHSGASGSWYEDYPATAKFSVTQTAALPTTLGTLTATKRRTVPLEFSSCTEQRLMGRVSIELELSEEASPWKNVLRYETLVDGEPWAFVSPTHGALEGPARWTERGNALLTTCCDPEAHYPLDNALEAGKHAIVFRGSLPGTDVVVETAPIEVTLSCDDGQPAGGGSFGVGPTNDRSDQQGQETGDASVEVSRSGCAIADNPQKMTGAIGWLLGLLAFAWRRRSAK